MFRLFVAICALVLSLSVGHVARATNCFGGQQWRDLEQARQLEDEARVRSLIADLLAKHEPGAAWEQAVLFADGASGQTADPAKAYALFKQAAKEGDSRAFFRLGIFYLKGLPPVKANEKVARSWFVKAKSGLERDLNKGCHDAALFLSDMYNGGPPGVPQDSGKARQVWLDYIETLRGLAKKTSDPRLEFEAARAYLDPPRWILFEQSWNALAKQAEAVRILEPLARAGYVPAEFQLSLLLRNDSAAYFDLVRARQLLAHAADQGHPAAQAELGADLSGASESAFTYDFPRDRKKSRMWLKKAEAAGSSFAHHMLEELDRLEKCELKNPLQLFGLRLACLTTTRDAMRKAIGAAGGVLLNGNDGKHYFYDKFEATRLLKGASELYVGYRVDDKTFASADYIFKTTPSSKARVYADLVGKLTQKYGEPKRDYSTFVEWQFDDPFMLVKIEQKFDHVLLQYKDWGNEKHLQRQIESSKRRSQAQEAAKESNAY